jgi:hypothetical protein
MTFETILLLAAGGYLAYTFLWKKGDASAPTTSGLGDLFKNVGGAQTQVDNGTVNSVKVMKDWDALYNDAEALKLTEAQKHLDAMWGTLNPRAGKNQVL